MTTISDRYDSLHVEVALPNEQVTGELRGRHDIVISVAPGYAERTGEAAMEVQLARLARLLFAHRSAAFERLNRENLGTGHITREPSPQQNAFRSAYESMTVTGSSHDGTVRCTTVGLEHWTVEITSGAIDGYGSAGLSRAATEAANDLVRSALAGVKQARHDAFAKHG